MSVASLRAAAVQLVSSDDVAANLGEAARLIAAAAAEGAQLVVLPENFAFMGSDDAARLGHAEPLWSPPVREPGDVDNAASTPSRLEGEPGDANTAIATSCSPGTEPGGGAMLGTSCPIQRFLHTQAREHGIWIVGGTLPLGAPGALRVHSSMLVYSPRGRRCARYDKIHLFDVDVPGSSAHYRESNSTIAGERVVVTSTPFGGLGLAVCYDVRFPELFRAMSGPGLALIALSSAFTPQTGAVHWAALVRARAIENQAALVAASQGGAHTAGRRTYGHSMIVDAWGRVLAERATGAGIVVADIDLAEQAAIRQDFPALDHRRVWQARIEED